ncbi:MAG: LEA type 2 family protein [Nitrospirae bacterium]|nr:LEA type 2 family protein [Nitrospirota bacterium]MBI3351543.1 LEA type 2 family protein [Nitrospirota bacterium]
MKALFYSMALLISFSSGSCAPALVKPDFSVQEIELTGVSFSAMDLAFKVKVTNPNRAGVKIEKLSYHLDLNHTELGSGELLKPVFINASDSQIVTLPFSSSFMGMSKTLTLLLGNDEINYELNGTVILSKFLIKQEFPFSSKGAVPVNRSTFHHE